MIICVPLSLVVAGRYWIRCVPDTIKVRVREVVSVVVGAMKPRCNWRIAGRGGYGSPPIGYRLLHRDVIDRKKLPLCIQHHECSQTNE